VVTPPVDNFIFYVPQLIFIHMDNLTYNLTEMEPDRLRITITQDNTELGSLYYERAKKTFNRKPIGMNAWGCVDAKIEGLYEMNTDITPTVIMNKCQEIIRESGY
jgi:hypothetical protein